MASGIARGACARRDDVDGVAQHGDHTPKKGQPWFTVYSFSFDIGHPYYNQLTPDKTRFPLTSIT